MLKLVMKLGFFYGGINMRKDFLWGSSISGGQCEGGFDSRSETVVDIIPAGKDTRFQYLNNPGIYLTRPEGFYPSQKGVEFYVRV
mgnify:CR=1 FL=1